MWKSEEYNAVVNYSIDDCHLVYKLWEKGNKESISAFSVEKEEVIKMEVNW